MGRKNYTWIRVEKDAKKILDERLNKINKVDLPKIGASNKRIKQIDLTKYLFKTKIFISDKELINLSKLKKKGRIC